MKPNRSKVHFVMREFKRGTLKSSSGRRVTNPKQAIAIAMSEGRRRTRNAYRRGLRRGSRNGGRR